MPGAAKPDSIPAAGENDRAAVRDGADPYLSVVLPCRDQADHIGPLASRYVAALGTIGRPFELVFVPNACTDATAERLREEARGDPRLRVVELAEAGWGRAVLAGLAACRADIVCYANSARTEPGTIVDLLARYRAHAPCLAKVRRVRRGAFVREWGSALYNAEARLLYGIEARDVNGTPKIFSRDLYRRLRLRSAGDLLDLEVMAKAARLKIPVVELRLPGFKRHGGASTTTLNSAWRMYAGALKLRTCVAAFRDEVDDTHPTRA